MFEHGLRLPNLILQFQNFLDFFLTISTVFLHYKNDMAYYRTLAISFTDQGNILYGTGSPIYELNRANRTGRITH